MLGPVVRSGGAFAAPLGPARDGRTTSPRAPREGAGRAPPEGGGYEREPAGGAAGGRFLR